MSYKYSAFFGIKQPRGGYLVTEQTIVVGNCYDDAVSKALYMVPRGEELLCMELIARIED